MKPESTNLGTSEYAMGSADDSPYLFMKSDSTNLGTSEYAMGTADDSPYLFMKPDSTNLGTSEYAMGSADDTRHYAMRTVTDPDTDTDFENFNSSVVPRVDATRSTPETEPFYASVRKTHGKGTPTTAYDHLNRHSGNGSLTDNDFANDGYSLPFSPSSSAYAVSNSTCMDVTIAPRNDKGAYLDIDEHVHIDTERRTPYQDLDLNVLMGNESTLKTVFYDTIKTGAIKINPERDYYSVSNFDGFDLDEGIPAKESAGYYAMPASDGGKLVFENTPRTPDASGNTAASYHTWVGFLDDADEL